MIAQTMTKSIRSAIRSCSRNLNNSAERLIAVFAGLNDKQETTLAGEISSLTRISPTRSPLGTDLNRGGALLITTDRSYATPLCRLFRHSAARGQRID